MTAPCAPEIPRLPGEWARWRTNEHGLELLEASFDKHVYERHMHEAYAIGVTLRGVQRFWCRGAVHDGTPGDVIAISPGEVHDGRSGAPGGYAYMMIYVPAAWMRASIADVFEGAATDVHACSPLVRDAGLARQLRLAWTAIADRPRSLEGDELLHRAVLRLALRHGGVRQPRERSEPARPLLRVRDYLRARMAEDVRAEDLARVAGMSRFRLTRQFQRAFGLPLHAYLLHLRLEESKRRLRRGASIAQVATDLGFTDQSHFHRRFKGAFGVSPGAWRAAVRS